MSHIPALDWRELAPATRLAIGRDIVRASGHGDPKHFKLVADIDRAWFLALNSPAFRAAIAATLSSEEPPR